MQPDLEMSAKEMCHSDGPTMKYHFFPPSTGLLFSSLAMLSLSVMGTESEKPGSGSQDVENTVENERDEEGDDRQRQERAPKQED